MRKISVRILIITLIAAIASIGGILTLSTGLARMSSMHEEIMSYSVLNRQQMAMIGMYLDRHHAMVNNCVIASGEDTYRLYKEEEEALRSREKELILSFGERMKGGAREKLYHRVYSNFVSYIDNVDTILSFADADMEVASYYNDNILSGFIDTIHSNIALLDDMMVTEIDLAEEQMDRFIDLSKLLRLVIIVIVACISAACIAYCLSLSRSMESYKTQLEEELILKNKALQEHDEHFLKLQNSVIMGIATLIESRDLETGEHVQRTSDYVSMLAYASRERGQYKDVLTDEYIERLIKAAPLHDIGKITVPDRILLKPGRFTTEEFEEMKKHASAGRDIARDIFGELEDKDYVRIVEEVAGGHHEKWNGEGYPAGLKGEEIPLSARIMAIADVFDALVSKRHYKDAYPVANAFKIIEDSGGSHFDPALTEVFLSLREKIEDYLA